MAFELGGRKHVFTDWDLIDPGSGLERYYPSQEDDGITGPRMIGTREMPYGLRISTHAPRIDPDRLVQPDTPAEGKFICFANIFEDDGLFRMYMMNWGKVNIEWDNQHAGWLQGGHLSEYFLTYAESLDGFNWTKPNVGAIKSDGSADNNLVYAGHASPAFKDPSAPPDERYKLVTMGIENGKALMFGAVSPDGFHFKTLEKPLFSEPYGSDTHNVIRFDPDKGRYVGYFRGKWHGNRNMRTIAYAETDRFDSWPSLPEVVATPDVHDQPDTDIYTNSYIRWPDADAHLMFPAFFQRRLDDMEIHMMTSRDGLHWERPMRDPIIPIGNPGSVIESSLYAGSDLIKVRPGEWALPISPRPGSHGQYEWPGESEIAPHRGYVCLASWREDGFMSLETETEGFCSTISINFTGGQLEVSAWTRYGGGILVELVDPSTETKMRGADSVVGRRFDDCDPISGDVYNQTVTWRGESDLSEWSGKPIRLRFKLRRARLYSFRFVGDIGVSGVQGIPHGAMDKPVEDPF